MSLSNHETMAGVLVGILTTKPLTFLLYKCKVTKLGSKAMNFFSGKRRRGGERQREKERERHKEIEGERADNKNHGYCYIAQLVNNK
jgi:hypothetical protein